ncbi:MAG: hypothetical protein U1F98_07720 [Verrucomicrobiota bacterium]
MKILVSALALSAALTANVAHGAFVLFDNFSSYTTNRPLVGQGPLGNEWQLTGGDTNILVVTNYQGVRLPWIVSAPGNSGAWRSLAPAGLDIASTSTAATVFCEFAYFNPVPGTSPTYNQWNFIVTDRLPNNTASTSQVQLNWDSTQTSPGGGVSTFRIRNGGAFVFASIDGTAAGDVPVGLNYIATTYKVWFLINAASLTYEVYMQNDAIPSLSGSPHKIYADNGAGGTFSFRNATAVGSLTNINMGCTPTPQSGGVVFDNIYVDTTGTNLSSPAGVIPITPPTTQSTTLALSTKRVTGLNIITGSAGNTYFDRQQVRLVNTVGTDWYGNASAGSPVEYSFTIKSFANTNAGEQAYLYLVPNAGIANSPDYNNDAAVVVQVSKSADPTKATMEFHYKVAEANGNDMFYGRGSYTNAPGSWDGSTTNWLESGFLGIVTNVNVAGDPAVGKWIVRFTSDTNVTLIAPNSTATSLVIPPYNIAPFNAPTNFGIYLGNMAQNSQGLNQDIVYSQFSATGVPAPYTDTFDNDSALSPAWDKTTSANQSCVFLLTTNAVYLATWPVVNGAYWLLQGNGDLGNTSGWSQLTAYPLIQEVGQVQQYISASEAPPAAGYYRLKQTTFSQLQVLLPGETSAPGTVSGKTGTPTPISLNDGGFLNVTVNACDSSWNIISSISDRIHLTSDDPYSIVPNDASLAGGTITFGVSGTTTPVSFGSAGSWTVTATDTSVFSQNIPPATSSPVTVAP